MKAGFPIWIRDTRYCPVKRAGICSRPDLLTASEYWDLFHAYPHHVAPYLKEARAYAKRELSALNSLKQVCALLPPSLGFKITGDDRHNAKKRAEFLLKVSVWLDSHCNMQRTGLSLADDVVRRLTYGKLNYNPEGFVIETIRLIHTTRANICPLLLPTGSK